MGDSANDRNVVITNKGNKKQLINLIVDSLKHLKIPSANRKLVVTGPDPVPFEVTLTGIIYRMDLKTLHEEADTMIVSVLCIPQCFNG